MELERIMLSEITRLKKTNITCFLSNMVCREKKTCKYKRTIREEKRDRVWGRGDNNCKWG
jgi:hypothetical protein